jgi:hypothetical protein
LAELSWFACVLRLHRHTGELAEHLGDRVELCLPYRSAAAPGSASASLLRPTGVWVSRLDACLPHVVKLRNRSGALVPLIPNLVQMRFAERRTRRNIILKARQMGVTTYIAARFFLKTILRPGTVTLQVAHTLESAEQIFRIVHRFLATLHPAARAALGRIRASARELAFDSLDSRYLVATAGSPNAGRGLTIHNLHLSEFARWPGRPQETLAGLLAAVPPDGEVEIESTPNGAGGCFHQEWTRACTRGVRELAPALLSGDSAPPGSASEPLCFTPHFFPWWLEPAYTLPLLPGEALHPLSDEEQLLIKHHRLSPGQIRFRRHLRSTFGALTPQEYAESDTECFLATGQPVFDLPAIDARLRDLRAPGRESQKDAATTLVNGQDAATTFVNAEDAPANSARVNARLPCHPERSEGSAFSPELVWFDPQPGRSYIIGADVAEGGDRGDDSAAVVLEAATGLQCAELLARWPIHRFAQELAALGRRYNHALLAVERNNHGYAVLEALAHQFAYENLYRHSEALASPLSPQHSKPGWPMNVATKSEAIGRLCAALRQCPEIFRSRRLLEQCRSYVYLPGGECGALPGMYDDLVVAAAIALAVRARHHAERSFFGGVHSPSRTF